MTAPDDVFGRPPPVKRTVALVAATLINLSLFGMGLCLNVKAVLASPIDCSRGCIDPPSKFFCCDCAMIEPCPVLDAGNLAKTTAIHADTLSKVIKTFTHSTNTENTVLSFGRNGPRDKFYRLSFDRDPTMFPIDKFPLLKKDGQIAYAARLNTIDGGAETREAFLYGPQTINQAQTASNILNDTIKRRDLTRQARLEIYSALLILLDPQSDRDLRSVRSFINCAADARDDMQINSEAKRVVVSLIVRAQIAYALNGVIDIGEQK
jgi:hypothetical protein